MAGKCALTLATAILLGGAFGPAPTAAQDRPVAEPAPATDTAAPAPAVLPGAPPSSTPATTPAPAEATPFTTRYGYFVPTAFSDLPGWREDNLIEAWRAFRANCGALSARIAWSGVCARSATVPANDNGAVRQFIEREFQPFQIHERDGTPAGIITGYFEPQLSGSRRYGDGFVVPVYGVPGDLLFLDSRRLPYGEPGRPVYARVEGRNVLPVCTGLASDNACTGPYVVDVAGANPDIRDKKLRVRIAGDRILPYYTRGEIEKGALERAPVMAWVDDAAALYSMQIQGSGKIRLTDGEVIRLAYGEQNGQPFTPPQRKAEVRFKYAPGGRRVMTRGLELDADDDEAPPETPPGVLTRSLGPLAGPAPGGGATTPARKRVDEPVTPEVERMVELLLKGNAAPQSVATATTPAAKAEPAAKAPAKGEVAAKAAPAARPTAPPRTQLASATPAGVTSGPARPVESAPQWFSSDPSYVFFRQIPDSADGPPGALGVPLTPGRSVAIDPRTTPLGSPVYVSTEGGPLGQRVARLMLAQDTGGAIRGAVRADFFWGFGTAAGQLASRMKESGRMWLLLPRGAPVGNGVVTRGGAGGARGEAECVLPDPELCVE